MALYDKIIGFVWLFLGILICLMSNRIKLGEPSSPGSGFIPFLNGCLLIFLSLIDLIRIFFASKDSREKKGFWDGVMWDKPAFAVASLIAYILLLPILGYLITTFLFLVFLIKLIEPLRWRTVFIISAATVAGSYLVFSYWLMCQFPRGILPYGSFW
jgi:putative tricarboxylic transport membrane protein